MGVYLNEFCLVGVYLREFCPGGGLSEGVLSGGVYLREFCLVGVISGSFVLVRFI